MDADRAQGRRRTGVEEDVAAEDDPMRIAALDVDRPAIPQGEPGADALQSIAFEQARATAKEDPLIAIAEDAVTDDPAGVLERREHDRRRRELRPDRLPEADRLTLDRFDRQAGEISVRARLEGFRDLAGGEGLRQPFPEGDAAFRHAGGVLPIAMVIESVVRGTLDHAALHDGAVHACVHHGPFAAEQVVRAGPGHEVAVDPPMPAMPVGLIQAGLGGEESAIADDDLAAAVEHDGGRGAVDEPQHVADLEHTGGTIGRLPGVVTERRQQLTPLQGEPIQPIAHLLLKQRTQLR